LAERYRSALADIPVWSCPFPALGRPVCWLFSLLIDETVAGAGRDQAMAALGEAGIDTRPFFFPLHEMPPYGHGTGPFRKRKSWPAGPVPAFRRPPDGRRHRPGGPRHEGGPASGLSAGKARRHYRLIRRFLLLCIRQSWKSDEPVHGVSDSPRFRLEETMFEQKAVAAKIHELYPDIRKYASACPSRRTS
jgi:hypothetical protein